MRTKSLAEIAAIALTVASVAHAQPQGAPPIGAPRSLLPPGVNADSLPSLEEPQPETRPPIIARAPAVEIGSLGSVEGPVAGLLDDASGGLGAQMWQGIDRASAIAMLKDIPATTSSEAERLLIRKLLLTSAAPPLGAADRSFNALRLTRLTDGGFSEDAADLALKISAPNTPDIVRAQANALILAGRDDMCGDMTKRRLESAEPFWAELRAFCYAASGDTGAFELTRTVIADQGIVDPAFLMLLNGIMAGKGAAPEIIRLPDALQLFMLKKLKLPIPPEIEEELGIEGSLAVAASPETVREARIAAAEKAMRAGILPVPLLGQILDTYTFTAQGLTAASAIARNEPLMSALARIRAALKRATGAEAKAELIHSAFAIGEREGVFAPVARLFSDDAVGIFPGPDWNNWSDLMVRGLLLAGQGDAAARWTTILEGFGDSRDAMARSSERLQLTLALAAPDIADSRATDRALSAIAARVAGSSTPGAAAEATLILGLFDALDRPLPDGVKDLVASLMQSSYPGRAVPPAILNRVERAGGETGRGALVLAVLDAIGAHGAGDLTPGDAVRLVRALKAAGIRDAADALAMEAMLLRPASGL